MTEVLAYSGEAERSFRRGGKLSSMTEGAAPHGSSFRPYGRLCRLRHNLLI
jgi:hypothetical protein